MKNLFMILLLLCSFQIIVSAEFIVVGNEKIEYDEAAEQDTTGNGKIDRKSYYANNLLVATEYDTTGDGVFDFATKYNEDMAVVLESVDEDGDGRPDVVREIGAEEQILTENKAQFDEKQEQDEASASKASNFHILIVGGFFVFILGIAVIFKKK